jgi:hypothetical protein
MDAAELLSSTLSELHLFSQLIIDRQIKTA